jgi:hypothetical protein
MSGGFGYAKDPVFLLSLALYGLNRLLIKPHWSRHWMLGSFVHDHLNDSLLVPVALPIFLAVYRGLNLREHDRPPTLRETMGHALLWSVYFEVFAPRFLHHGTADFGDAVSYVVGGLVAWAFWNYPFRLLHSVSKGVGQN